MIHVTELAFGLEKLWIRRERDAKCVPWHVCLIAMIVGILFGDASGIVMRGGGHVVFAGVMCCEAAALVLFRVSRFRWDVRRMAMWGIGWCMLWLTLGIWMGSPREAAHLPMDEVCQVSGEIESVQPGASQILVVLNSWSCSNERGEGAVRVRMNVSEAELRDEAHILAHGERFVTQGRFVGYEAPDVPGMFDSAVWAHSQGIQGGFRHTGNLEMVDSTLSFPGRLEWSRRAAFERLADVSPKGILPALVLGTTKDIDGQTRQSFGHLGIAHVLAVSGLHFGLIAMMIHAVMGLIFGRIPWVLRRFGRRKAASVASLPVLIVYLVFVGAPISAQRALLMAVVCVLARLFASHSDRTRALSLSGLTILCIDPLAVLQIGFQLSMSAVIGIIWGMDCYERLVRIRIIEKVWGKKKERIVCVCAETLCMTLSTALTTAPFVMYHFGLLPVMGIWTNIVVIPYVSFILMPLAMLAMLFAVTGMPGAQGIFALAGFAETWLTEFASFCDEHLPLAYVEVTPHGGLSVVAAVTAGVLLFRFRLCRYRIVLACISCAIMAFCIAMCQFDSRWLTRTSELRMSFVAMGQADATLIEFPDGHVMIVDVGSEVGRDENMVQSHLIPYLKRLGIRHVDTVVVTHSDYDHVAGLDTLLNFVSVGSIWHNGLENAAWMSQVHDVPMVSVLDTPGVQQVGGASVSILWPVLGSREILEAYGTLSPNESSVVMRLDYGRFSAILTGDAGVPVEEYLLDNGAAEHVNVLKVGHHGSKSASSEAWIERIRPEIAIFSAGLRNRYRFPHREVQMRLHRVSSRMYQTGVRGTIRLSSDGEHFLVESMR